MRKALYIAICFIGLFACNEGEFARSPVSVDQEDPVPGPTTKDVIKPDTQITLPATLKLTYGKADQAIDYLFIIDNSISMETILSQVNQGFASIAADNVFPENALVAVMTTMIGDVNNFSVTHSSIAKYTGIEQEPGFLDFVNKSQIDSYKQNVPDKANKWTIDGCVEKWFKPNSTNGAGVSCMQAHTQSTFSALIAEPGIVAYEQLLMKNQNNKIFRDDAIVNVIYVSDTHDPGVTGDTGAQLVASRKNYAQLKEMTEAANKINGLKFHALAPDNPGCGSGEELNNLSYFTLVDEATGVKENSCVTNNYVDFIKKMVEASQVAEPEFELPSDLKEITAVKVNDVETSNYSLIEDGKKIRIEGLDPKTPTQVSIVYTLKDE